MLTVSPQSEAPMPNDPCQSDCLQRAAHWRLRATAAAQSELRDAYYNLADSYECLAAQAAVCRRLVLANAARRGEAAPCQCGPEALTQAL